MLNGDNIINYDVHDDDDDHDDDVHDNNSE
jgi:hypothetical protein